MRVTRDALAAWGERFGAAVRTPHVVAVRGALGAGKTTLIQAICRGFGVSEPVTSPTFTLVHAHVAGFPHPDGLVYHLDLYRLDDPADPDGRSGGPGADALGPLGWDEVLAANALVLIEWPERAGDRLPSAHTAMALEAVAGDPTRRELHIG